MIETSTERSLQISVRVQPPTCSQSYCRLYLEGLVIVHLARPQQDDRRLSHDGPVAGTRSRKIPSNLKAGSQASDSMPTRVNIM
ncbi:hypothetical protein PoB_002331300 [Plakobranchus ocellatus]|uniref:Uncharacterized protein n=1 Tax=Plakobranchus ocellatus TaxID=259542 RepID=A0AAV3ZQH3_9GAST|nr:hypothetical protein PoB_002331300 [Plakobranchus ocellatus]